MQLERDPLTYLFRSDDARKVMAELRDGEPHLPSEVRRKLAVHPQSFRELVEHLDAYGLVDLAVQKGSRAERTPQGWGVKVVLQATPAGLALLEVLERATHDIADVVHRKGKLLPPATVERWQEA
ncbi:MAG: hypothetical protein KGJ23_13885 [Euryarchaeota archaeon]|nr:hypothetical protein [Euryarchaeota archaeon]MDE1837688.1 hypothetical protein [Euryarchaeota archaeon]MDE1881794.1 hypothetical protein [Euryarchaeota archaeon]MDE2045982.1 hypothetical protein [Thermoplasmata archaeon]